MLCVGGPKHGVDINCNGLCFYALRERPSRALYSQNPKDLPDDPMQVVTYRRQSILSDGKWVAIWVVE